MPDQLWVLKYQYVPDIVERRAPLRDEHLALLRAGYEAGDVIRAGATGEPPTGALFVFRTREAAEAYVEADPYGEAGLVVRHRIEPWTLVIGA